MPMVTLFKTLDVTNVVRTSRKTGCGFNLLMCFVVGKAAAAGEDFYLLPAGNRMLQYEKIAVNTIIETEDGEIAACDIPFSDDAEDFAENYLCLTEQVRRTGQEYAAGEDYMVIGEDGEIAACDIPFSDDAEDFAENYLCLTEQVRRTGQEYAAGEDYMVIGTSVLAQYEIDGAVNLYAGIYNNPFLIWGRYRKKMFRAKLPVSFQFHHAQMDGIPAAQFLERLQKELDSLNAAAFGGKRKEMSCKSR